MTHMAQQLITNHPWRLLAIAIIAVAILLMLGMKAAGGFFADGKNGLAGNLGSSHYNVPVTKSNR